MNVRHPYGKNRVKIVPLKFCIITLLTFRDMHNLDMANICLSTYRVN